jgi:hypothetical protein
MKKQNDTDIIEHNQMIDTTSSLPIPDVNPNPTNSEHVIDTEKDTRDDTHTVTKPIPQK